MDPIRLKNDLPAGFKAFPKQADDAVALRPGVVGKAAIGAHFRQRSGAGQVMQRRTP